MGPEASIMERGVAVLVCRIGICFTLDELDNTNHKMIEYPEQKTQIIHLKSVYRTKRHKNGHCPFKGLKFVCGSIYNSGSFCLQLCVCLHLSMTVVVTVVVQVQMCECVSERLYPLRSVRTLARMSRWPWLAARCRGVSSPRFMTLMRAPLMMSISTTPERPSRHAQCNGLNP